MKGITHRIIALQRFVRNDIKTIVGVEAVKDAKQNFKDGGFAGKEWEKRKSKNRKGKKDTKPLTDSGDLGDSIDWEADFNGVKVGSDLDYAQVHNEGLKAGRGNGFQMPKRQFLGETKRMNSAVKNKIDRELNKLFK